MPIAPWRNEEAMPPKESTRKRARRGKAAKRPISSAEPTFVEAGTADPAIRNRALAEALLDWLAPEAITSIAWNEERLAWEVSLI